jgi:hypothetical protein
MPFCRLFALVGFLWGMDSCQVSDGKRQHSLERATAPEPECSKMADIVVDMKGSYDINTAAASEIASPCPYVYWEPSLSGLVSIDTRLRGIGGPACLPSIEAAARDMCSVTVTRDQVRVACVDDNGKVRVGTESFTNIATSLKLAPACLRIVDRIGRHDLDKRVAEWHANRTACADKAATRKKTPVFLEISESSRSVECLSSGPIICASLRLSIPVVKLTRDLGEIGNYPACAASRTTDPRGIRFACSDLGLSAANVYSVGNKVFFRTGHGHTGDSKKSEDVSVQSVELPCDQEPEFKIRSQVKIEWASEPNGR